MIDKKIIMKIKLLFLTTISVVLLNSCSGDGEREEEIGPVQKTVKTEKILNIKEVNVKAESIINQVDSTIVRPSSGTVPIKDDNPDAEIIPPGDVRPPKK